MKEPTQFGIADEPEFIQLGDKSAVFDYGERSAALLQHRFVVDVRSKLRNQPESGTRTVGALAKQLEVASGTLGNHVNGRAWMPSGVMLAVVYIFGDLNLLPMTNTMDDLDPTIKRRDLA